MPSPDAIFARFVESLRLLRDWPLGAEGDERYHALADKYDLESAWDALRLFLDEGRLELLQEGLDRLDLVIDRSGGAQRKEPKRHVDVLRTLGPTLDSEERQRATQVLQQRMARRDNVPKPLRCDALVISALLDPELRAFNGQLEAFEERVGTREEGLPGLTYFRGTLAGNHGLTDDPLRIVSVFQDQPGLVDCSTLVVNGMRSFDPAVVALTGVCAGRRAMGVRKLDLIIPSAVFTCDTGKYTETAFKREPYWVEPSPQVLRRVRLVGVDILASISDEINRITPKRTRAPKIHTDAMACGSAVVDRPAMIDEIALTHRKVVGLDMESFAAVRAARLTDSRVRVFVVKSVMDYATGKTDALKGQAAFWSGAFLARFLVEQFTSIVAGTDGREA